MTALSIMSLSALLVLLTFVTSRLICTIMDSFHYDVSLSTYVEAQVGLNIATDKGKKRGKTEDSKEAVAQSERPEERPSNIQPGVAVEPMNVDIELPAVGDDVDEGIDVSDLNAKYHRMNMLKVLVIMYKID